MAHLSLYFHYFTEGVLHSAKPPKTENPSCTTATTLMLIRGYLNFHSWFSGSAVPDPVKFGMVKGLEVRLRFSYLLILALGFGQERQV